MCVHDCIWHAWCQCLVCECVTNALVCARANALVRVCMRARANALICAPAYGMLACAVLRVAGACTPSLTSPDAERRPWTCVLERWRARARAVAARVEGCCTPTAAVCVCLCVCVRVCVLAWPMCSRALSGRRRHSGTTTANHRVRGCRVVLLLPMWCLGQRPAF